ncbi:MAG TPA: HIT domain-containing protein [Steroidobacteraceae bacterium]|nr:HIT domain-containing protein [Steroidobacteraceae bacterium]
MTNDFYCDEALSGRTPVKVVRETDDVLAFHHTRPYWAVHIVVVPKVHVPSLTDLGGQDVSIVHRLLDVVREVAAEVEAQYGGCRVATNLGRYQDSKHLHSMSDSEIREDDTCLQSAKLVFREDELRPENAQQGHAGDAQNERA